MKIHAWLAVGALTLLLVGCSPLFGAGQTNVTSTHTILSAGQTAGQTFTALHGGLASLELYLAPFQAGTGQITLHLRSSVNATTDLASASLPVDQITHPGYYSFTITPQANSYLRDYYLLTELIGPGEVKLGSAEGNTYLDGALYLNGAPVDAQIAFRPVYALRLAGMALFNQGLAWLWQLILGVILFIVPGWALLSALWPEWRQYNLGEKTGLAAGMSLVCYPLLMLWTHLVGLNLGPLYAWLPVILGVGFIAWNNRHQARSIVEKFSNKTPLKNWLVLTPETLLPDLGLILVTLLIIGVRLWVSRTLVIPMWGDSYQHSLMAQLLVDHNGLFDSWQPYADLFSFSYHFGFHASAAVYHWLSGTDIPESVLQVGQWFNSLAVLALYPLAYRITRQRWAGTAAVLVAGLLLSVPMIYVNWGRYTQLAGQLVMPVAICLAWTALDQSRFSWRSIVLAGIALSGLALTHYRVLIFTACFFPAWFVFNLNKSSWRTVLTRLSVLTGVAFGLFLPWFVHVFGGRLMQMFARQISQLAPQPAAGGQDLALSGDLLGYLSSGMWLILAMCVAWGLWRRDKWISIFSLWWLLAALVVNPQWLRLPGEGALTNFALAIAAYIFAGILLGSALGWFLRDHLWLNKPVIHLALLLIFAAAGVWGARQRLYDIAISQGTLVTRADIRAMTWIQANTPPDSRFLVNSFQAFSNTSVVGSDAGWWLPLLAHRQTSLPPLTYVSELGPQANYIAWVNQLTRTLLSNGLEQPQSLALLQERGINYLYIGQLQGQVNNPGPLVLDPAPLQKDPSFQVIYHQDRVWIFKIIR